MLGFIPQLVDLVAKPSVTRNFLVETAYFIGQVYSTSREALQMLIAANGLKIMNSFMKLPWADNKDLIMIAIDSFMVIFDD